MALRRTIVAVALSIALVTGPRAWAVQDLGELSFCMGKVTQTFLRTSGVLSTSRWTSTF